jgi:hypothetical protein
MSEYNRSFVDAYKHLNSDYEFGGRVDDMEMVAGLVMDTNYGVHRLFSAIYRKSYGNHGCVNNDKIRELLEEVISLL